jgi:hypothetical protein
LDPIIGQGWCERFLKAHNTRIRLALKFQKSLNTRIMLVKKVLKKYPILRSGKYVQKAHISDNDVTLEVFNLQK